jgi:molybdenum cofactor cytidylyltransferase
MKRVCAILLAAGESRRMGRINKLALPVAGEPLLRRSARTLMESALDEIVVVVGHDQHTARALIADLPLGIVYNARYQEGQMTSLECGMAALETPCDGVMVCLSDQPLLEPRDIDRLAQAFLCHCPTSVLVPTWRGQRGNPVILDYRHRATILEGGHNLGCRHLIDGNPQLVTPLEMDNDHVTVDMDTPEEYQRLLQRLTRDHESAGGATASAGS